MHILLFPILPNDLGNIFLRLLPIQEHLPLTKFFVGVFVTIKMIEEPNQQNLIESGAVIEADSGVIE